MKTKKWDEKKMADLQSVSDALSGACIITVKYKEDGVMAYGVFTDGVTEFLFIPYNIEEDREGQHFLAEKYIDKMNSKERQPW